MRSTRDGGYIIVGNSESHDYDLQGAPPNAVTGWVVKLDEYGQIQWSKIVGGDNNNSLTSVIETSEGDFVVVGGTTTLYLGVTKTHGGGDALVVKLNKNGDILWQKVYGGSGNDYAASIIEINREGGGFVFTGSTSSLDGDVSGRHSTSSVYQGDSTDIWVVQISNTGDIQWQKCLGGSKEEGANSIIQTQDGGFAITGATTSDDGDVVGHTGKNLNLWIIKLNASGNILWQKCNNNATSNGFNLSTNIVETSDRGLTIIGSSMDSTIQGYHKPHNADFDEGEIYVVHLNSSGSILWERCYGGSYMDRGESIITTADGGYIFIGSTQSNDGDVTDNHKRIDGAPRDDVWVVKLRNNGNIEWQKCYGGSSFDLGNSIVQTKDGKILFTASTISFDGDVTSPHYNALDRVIQGDIWVVKLGTTADVQVNYNFDFTGLIRDKFLKIYPNPSSTSVHLEMLPWFTAKGVEIYNLLGTKLSCETTIAENGANVSVKSLPNGTYIARVAYTTEKVNGTFTLPLIVYH